LWRGQLLNDTLINSDLIEHCIGTIKNKTGKSNPATTEPSTPRTCWLENNNWGPDWNFNSRKKYFIEIFDSTLNVFLLIIFATSLSR
jgi:hypothetical protein